MNLEVNLGGIRLANPVVMAWGRYAVVKLRRGRGASFAWARGWPVPRLSWHDRDMTGIC